jgi:hypothetical protein
MVDNANVPQTKFMILNVEGPRSMSVLRITAGSSLLGAI